MFCGALVCHGKTSASRLPPASLSPGLCAGFLQVFREQAIDGETLPLLTEEHLLNNMGLKLGPALKIRSQVGSGPTQQRVSCFKAVSSQKRAGRRPVLLHRD